MACTPMGNFIGECSHQSKTMETKYAATINSMLPIQSWRALRKGQTPCAAHAACRQPCSATLLLWDADSSYFNKEPISMDDDEDLLGFLRLHRPQD